MESFQYLTCEISPSGLTGTNNFNLSPAIYSRNFTTPIIPENAGDYNVAVISYDIPSTTIPLLLPEIQPYPNTDPNLTPYSFTMTYNSFAGSQTYLSYISDNLNSVAPPPLSADSPTRNPLYNYYYYVFTANNWLVQLNRTLKNAFDTLKNEYILSGLSPAFPASATAPYFILLDGKISLISERAYFSFESVTPIYISWNTEMNRFMQGFPTLNTSLSNGRNFQFNNLYNKKNNAYQSPEAAPVYPPTLMKLSQEWDTFDSWNSMKSLNITTSTLPIKEEYVNNASSIVNNFGTEISRQALLATFIPLYGSSTLGDIRRRIQFSANYPRPISISRVPVINSVSLKVTWTDYLDREYDLYIEPWERLTIKLLFFREGSIFPMNRSDM